MLILSQNCAQAFNQFVNPIALAAIQWKYCKSDLLSPSSDSFF